MAKNRLFVGSVPYAATEADLLKHFANIGPCTVEVPLDRTTGKARGFAFVEYQSHADYETAIEKLNGQDFQGRELRVTEAEDPEERRGDRGDRGDRRERNSQRFADR